MGVKENTFRGVGYKVVEPSCTVGPPVLSVAVGEVNGDPGSNVGLDVKGNIV